MEAKELIISKLERDARIEYFNAKLRKMDARMRKVRALEISPAVIYGTLEYEMLRLEEQDLYVDIQAVRAIIQEQSLYHYDEFTITALESMAALYSCDTESESYDFRSEITSAQARLLRREMRRACIGNAGDKFTVRVEYWSSFVSYDISKVFADTESVSCLLSRIYDTRSGMITKRGKQTTFTN
jgi:hypothetical protein